MIDTGFLSALGLDTRFILPEVALTLGLLVVLGMNLLSHKKSQDDNLILMMVSIMFTLVVALLGLTLGARPLVGDTPQTAMYGSMAVDHLSYLIRLLLLFGAGITIAISHKFLEKNTRIIGDFYVLVMGATLGGMFLASALDLVLIFVGLETLSITSYILAGYLRKTARSAEASFKYLIYGGAASGIFLFGLSLLYGLAGSTKLLDIAVAIHQQGFAHPTMLVAALMVFGAFAFKLSAVPFHSWTPDVYDGAPTPVSAFLSVVSKAGAMAVMLRVLFIAFPEFAGWQTFWTILAVASMVLGNVVALKQKTVKRLLAYSTIAHAGYMLLGLTIGASAGGVSGILFYLITYVFMNLGAFACATYFSTKTGSDEIAAYSGLMQKRPWLAFAFTICLLSLAGIPITSGFFAKFFLFQSVISAGTGYLWLVGLALLASTVSLAYYINLIRLMVVKEPSEEVVALTPSGQTHWALATALSFCVVLTLGLGIYATPVFDFTTQTATQLVGEHPEPHPPVSQAPESRLP